MELAAVVVVIVVAAGTYAGGWRIMRTLGRRIIDLDPLRGFAAEATASAVLYTTAFVFAAPISTTTQTITSSILGVGATNRLSAVRWGWPATSRWPGSSRSRWRGCRRRWPSGPSTPSSTDQAGAATASPCARAASARRSS